MKTAIETRPGTAAAASRVALAGLALCMMLASLGTSLVNAALPALARAFPASFQQVQWVLLAYLVAMTAAAVAAGRLGDLFGRRRLLAAGILLFCLGSAAGMLAPSLSLLIAARAIQGIGGAVMAALSLALVTEAVPKAKTGAAMGLLGTMSAFGTALGPALGGLLLAGAGWRALFLVNLPLGLVALLLIRRMPEDRRVAMARPQPFDTLGAVALAATLAAYALAATTGHGRFGAANLAWLAAAGIGGCLFAAAERRAPAPLIARDAFGDRTLSASLAAGALVSAVMMTTLIVGPFYLARGLGLSDRDTGLALAIGPIVAALGGIPAGRLVDRVGTRAATLAGLAAVAAACLLLALSPARPGLGVYLAGIVLATAGYALFQAANNKEAITGVPPERRGLVAGLLGLTRNLGLVTGAASIGAVFAAASGRDAASALPAAVAAGMQASFALAAALAIAAWLVVLVGRAGRDQPMVTATGAEAMPLAMTTRL